MMMLFCRRLLQRYRAICHLIDPIISSGIDLYIAVHHKHSEAPQSYRTPWGVCNSSPETIRYIANNFGIEMNQFDKVKFTTDKRRKRDVSITLDGVKAEPSYIGIPYVDVYCYVNGRKILVGNPMSQALRAAQAKWTEKPNSVLVIHPGGGRGFISPAKKKSFDPQKVHTNNVILLSGLCNLLPSGVSSVTIKSHPIPYIGCDRASLESILPKVQSIAGVPLSVENENLLKLLSEHEFVINFGSSTVLWLLGSGKKWLNIVDQAKFPGYKYHRQRRERVSHWFEWAQNIPLSKLTQMIGEYDKMMIQPKSVRKVQEEYRQFYSMNAIDNVEKEIRAMNS